jgi:hypothetical protein
MKNGIIIFILTLLSCSNDEEKPATSADLKGVWIEVESETDTITFDLLGDSEILNLYRGKEIRNGNLLPKSGTGPYQYNLAEEKISLKWLLSSDSNYKDFYFKLIGNRMKIGNFYGSTSGEILTFEQLN